MDAQEAIQKAQAHLTNAMEQAKMPLIKEELMYQWDNQITAIDTFLAETEVLKDKLLDRARGSLRKVKKDLADAVIAFEAKQEGVEVPDEEPSDDEWVMEYTEMAGEMLALAKEALDEQVAKLEDLFKWEEPLAMLNGYLADSEPFQEMNHELKKARSLVRVARRELKANIEDAVKRLVSDEGDDGDD